MAEDSEHGALSDQSDGGPAPTDPGTTQDVRAEMPDIAGTFIGPYRLRERLGVGGFGEVYAADQTEPIRRLVALKIIKLGMDTKAVVARFEAERQALAMMDHPNIARIFDAGATTSGRPYFVMELVRGLPITQYCDEQRLTIRERLELFACVCQAVQHAHQKGVIHRDLKPSNVFVTLLDGRPVPKVIDFGIAKATDHRLTEGTFFTRQGEFIGTPEYMSPEQAEVTGLDVDTRADIYSLGVLLYELLTGTLPLDPATLRGAGFAEAVRIIREVDPPRPSTRLSTIESTSSRPQTAPAPPRTRLAREDIGEIAARRRTDPQSLRRLIRGDLDWITMRCLEKDRTRRYETANALALDIQRHLSDEVVLAGPPSNRYRVGKFARRHRLALVTGAAVGLALVLGLGLATYGLLQAKRERDTARSAEALARGEAAKAAAEEKFLEDMLASADPANTRGRDLTVRDALDASARRVDDGAFKAEPAIEAAVRMTVGRTYRALGLFAPAERHYRAALAIRRRTLAGSDSLVSASLQALAALLYDLSRPAEAESLCRGALAIDDGARPIRRSALESELTTLGFILQDRGAFAEAESLYRRALALNLAALPRRTGVVATSLSNLAGILAQENRAAEAESLFREALAIDEEVYGREHPEVGTDLHRLATLLADQGRNAEAESLFTQALALRRRVLGGDHPEVGITLVGLANLLDDEDRSAAAESLMRRAVAIDRKAYGASDDLAMDLKHLGDILERGGKLAEAESCFREVLEIRRHLAGADSLDVATALVYLADTLVERGRASEAEPLLRQALSIRERHLPAGDWQVSNTKVFLGRCLTALRRHDEAERTLLEAEAGLRADPQAPKGCWPRAARYLAELYSAWGRPEPAAAWRAKAAPGARPHAGSAAGAKPAPARTASPTASRRSRTAARRSDRWTPGARGNE